MLRVVYKRERKDRCAGRGLFRLICIVGKVCQFLLPQHLIEFDM